MRALFHSPLLLLLVFIAKPLLSNAQRVISGALLVIDNFDTNGTNALGFWHGGSFGTIEDGVSGLHISTDNVDGKSGSLLPPGLTDHLGKMTSIPS